MIVLFKQSPKGNVLTIAIAVAEVGEIGKIEILSIIPIK